MIPDTYTDGMRCVAIRNRGRAVEYKKYESGGPDLRTGDITVEYTTRRVRMLVGPETNMEQGRGRAFRAVVEDLPESTVNKKSVLSYGGFTYRAITTNLSQSGTIVDIVCVRA